MAIKNYKPITPGQRGMSALTNEDLTSIKPEKTLMVTLKNKAGRNNQGKITTRHQGGGEKRKYRIIDFKRNKYDIKGTVSSIEYDPNRNANIALINYVDGEKRYIIAPASLKVGQTVLSSKDKVIDIKPGNALALMNIPVGTVIHNIELRPGKGAELVRSAGASAQILGREGSYVMIRLTSSEVRKVLGSCMATIGSVGNEDASLVKLGKAGRTRHMGIRPTVRGSVMNPNDHPHGGGEGKAPVGRSGPMTPWGKPALGYKTRKKKASDKLIVRRKNGK